MKDIKEMIIDFINEYPNRSMTRAECLAFAVGVCKANNEDVISIEVIEFINNLYNSGKMGY